MSRKSPNNEGRKTLVLKGENILSESGLENVHRLSLRARVSAQTAYKYIHSPNEISSLDMSIVLALLMDGAGYTKKEILDMKVGDLFEIFDAPES